jgi:hypothetical protein
MKPIDITVPPDARLPAHPGNTPFTVEAVEPVARRDGSNLSPLHIDDRRALPPWVVDADGAPDRVLPRRN